MKGFKLILTATLALLVSQAGFSDTDSDTSRAATRRAAGTVGTVSSRRQQPSTSAKPVTATNISRTTSTPRTSSVSRERTTVTRTGTNATPAKNVSTRSATNIPVSSRTIKSRTATVPVTKATTARTGTTSRTGASVTRSAKQNTRTTNTARSTIKSLARSGTTLIDNITSRDYKTCREVFYNCMDEFCANKDATLKRCACSVRASEFAGMKQQLTKIEDKLLDFSQRLLTVNMDKEDALVLNQATEGEIAYGAKDKSESKKMLDQIAQKLNTSFDDNNFNQNLNAISLSLDSNIAFDTLDSTLGVDMTTKSGTALYNAALPVCREMAMEVCTDDDLSIAESGYQMSIEQDCNTVAKSYESQNDQARTKILESSALLDMSRLDIHQQRNSDDILTCKKKMLEMLTDSTVCGPEMSKCLDTTGRYINPTTGEAFLTEDLSGLGNLITRPGSGQTWTSVPGNEKFIQFLENKKLFLEPAMDKCQDIADYVWQDFIEDALAQIKLAQENKLEQVRQSCTTLTTQCLSDAIDSISEFDSRALSIFGVAADKTVNAMCSDIRNACTALLDGPSESWDTGMTMIAAGKTYDTILSTCQEVGRQCIIRSCKSVAGNFALCENIDTSINRKSIISRRSCWDEVSECVANTGSETIAQIMTEQNRAVDLTTSGSSLNDYTTYGDIYAQLYGLGRNDFAVLAAAKSSGTPSASNPTYTNIYDWCSADLGISGATEFEWQVCRLTEEIWGNCEHAPSTNLSDSTPKNMILTNESMDNHETLLSWFARNTGTASNPESCRDTTCGFDTISYNGVCSPRANFATDGLHCQSYDRFFIDSRKSFSSCCPSTNIISGKCCDSGNIVQLKSYSFTSHTNDAKTLDPTNMQICAPDINHKYAYLVSYTNDEMLICLSTKDNVADALTADSTNLSCVGYFIYVDRNKRQTYYNAPSYETTSAKTIIPQIEYYPEDACTNNICTKSCTFDGTTWTGDGCTITSPTNWHIIYKNKEE